jgi:hypothetical protein
VGFEEFTDVCAGLVQDLDELAAEFEGIFERSEIERVVEESAKQLEGAAVASFVPILAHSFKDGQAIRVFPFGYVAHDAAADPSRSSTPPSPSVPTASSARSR